MNFSIDPVSLKPLVEQVVAEVLGEMGRFRSAAPTGGPRLAYSEKEAAGMLGLNQWQLRDLRLRGEITSGRLVGKRVCYRHEDLVAFLESRRTEPTR